MTKERTRPSPKPATSGGAGRVTPAKTYRGSGKSVKPTALPAPKKPAANKPPYSGPPQTTKPPPSGKPQAVKPPRPVKPGRVPKPAEATKPPRAAKPSQVARPPEPLAVPTRARSAKPKPPTRTKPGARPQSPPVDEPIPNSRKLTCSIFGWRHGWVADFYAVAVGLQGHTWIVERSPPFYWRAGEVPREAYEAHAVLVDALLTAGWRPVDNEGAWYRTRFERPIENPS